VHAPVFSLALFLLAAAGQRPPSADEQRLFEEGARALQGGDPRAAEKAWQAGYAIGRDPAFLVHIGEAQEKAGLPGDAAETYRRYLQAAPDAADRAEIEARLTRLGPAAAVKPPAAPAAAGETPGEFGAGPAPALPQAPVPRAATEPRRADTEQPTGPPRDESGWTPYGLTAGISTAAAVTLLLTAGLFAAAVASDEDDLKRLQTYRSMTGAPPSYSSVMSQYEQAVADGDRHERYAKIALAGAGVAAAVAATFFVLDAKRTREPAVAVNPLPAKRGEVGEGFLIVPSAGGLAAAGTWRF
jgi:hypothetical protein